MCNFKYVRSYEQHASNDRRTVRTSVIKTRLTVRVVQVWEIAVTNLTQIQDGCLAAILFVRVIKLKLWHAQPASKGMTPTKFHDGLFGSFGEI